MASISVPSSEVDNEATAELPVLDVAAYEATLSGAEPLAHTDTWVLPSGSFVPAAPSAAEATTEMPSVKLEAIPTLTQSVPAYDLDHSGTHEMPAALLDAVAKPAKKAAARQRTADTPPVVPGAVVLPPSPPLIEELRTALADAERRITELHERARIADAERAVAVARANAECLQLREQLGAQIEELSTARGRLSLQGTDEAELTDALFARDDRISSLEQQLVERTVALEQTRAQLAASASRCEILECDTMNLRATVTRRNDQIAILEADLAARQQREQLLVARLNEALASVRPDVPQLHAEIGARDEKLLELKAELELARARSREVEDDLRVAEESIRQLESDLSDKTSKLEEASVTVEEWRAVIAESQRSILERDSRIQRLEAGIANRGAAPAESIDQTGEEIALEGPARVLIRTDGNTEFVHVLGRRTRIGRGSDNEIVLDTKHVSRYHAVLLAGPVNTSIEDLNSTNGVFVNGKRVNRQVLSNGDRVTVGRSQFRYTVRE
jgi:hypothetical protein